MMVAPRQIEDTYLYQEIHEQPQVLARFLDSAQADIQHLAEDIRARQVVYLAIAARGTSDNAARYASYLFGAVNRLPVALATPSLYTFYQSPPRFGNALVMGISQSGKSPDIVAVLQEARRQGALSTAVTNAPRSDLARTASHVIDLNAGQERSVAATKTYTCELAAIALLSATLAQDPAMLSALQETPALVAQTLAMESEIQRIAQRYCYMRACVVIGRGYNYATAFELALKMKELTYTVVEPYSSADFLHGPLAMIEPGFPVIVIAPRGALLPEMREFIHTLRRRDAEVIAISDDPELLSLARIPLALPASVPEWLSPLITIIPGQLLSLHLAHVRDFDPDRPRALQKVTRTR
ncbi:MAG: SIS domain-containing protein [Anaerolineales bacterium]|nr:SIS domain-containing protein [Anaerolineales bacterium]